MCENAFGSVTAVSAEGSPTPGSYHETQKIACKPCMWREVGFSLKWQPKVPKWRSKRLPKNQQKHTLGPKGITRIRKGCPPTKFGSVWEQCASKLQQNGAYSDVKTSKMRYPGSRNRCSENRGRRQGRSLKRYV